MFCACSLFMKQLSKKAVAVCILLLLLSLIPSLSLAGENEAYEHEFEVMDKCNNSFYIYADQDDGCNHFYPSGWMGDISSISFDSNWTSNCYSESCIKNTFIATGNNWAGIYWQEPENNWGIVQNGGYDITGATKITFWARGENGGEKVEFFAGGITGTYPDSLPKTSIGYVTLTNVWQEYTIDLTSKNLSHIIGGFGWATNSSNNLNGAIFYLDEIKYDKSRPDELRFLVSYEALSFSNLDSPDRYIKNTSYIYDNALALMTFLARGNDKDLRRAKILADAFVYARNNDRHYTDGRLRNAYMSGDLIDHLTGKARIPGWWDPADKKWQEDKLQISTHTGNLAWTMIALLRYYEKAGGAPYLEAAEALGEWIERETKDTQCAGGYTAGYEGGEPDPQKITWKSTEHNIGVYIAFMLLHEITGDTKWEERALHAKNFVNAMWNDTIGHFWTGTLDDGCNINRDNIPVDIQAWATMAIRNYNLSIRWVEDNCYTEADGFKGFDFNNDKDGIWFEGTAQMAVAYLVNKEESKSNFYIAEILKAQSSANNSNGKGIVAASHDGVTTGFDFKYFNRLNIGATSWYIFAEMEYNPLEPPNNPPVANGQSVETNEDTTIEIILTATDVDGDSLTYFTETNPVHGTLSGTPPIITYTPNPGYHGSDSFTFKANDGKADSNIATVSITIKTKLPTYALAGLIRDSKKIPIKEARVEARGSGGTLVGTALTDGQGSYLLYLPSGKYTLTPVKETHLFSPASRKITIKSKDVGKQNFTCKLFQINGGVKDRRNKPFPSVTMHLKWNDSTVATSTTDARGGYRFWFYNTGTYIVEPLKEGSRFNPLSIKVIITKGSKGRVNFKEAQ